LSGWVYAACLLPSCVKSGGGQTEEIQSIAMARQRAPKRQNVKRDVITAIDGHERRKDFLSEPEMARQGSRIRPVRS
jgi:hypothetical protein